MTPQEIITPSWLWVLSIPFWFALYVNPWFRLTAERFYLWVVTVLERKKE